MVIFSSSGCLVSGGDCFESVAVGAQFALPKQEGEGESEEAEGREDPHAEVVAAGGCSSSLFVLSLLQLTAMTPIRLEQKQGENESSHAKAREHDLRGSVSSGGIAELAIEQRE